jgi:hypothetical protein
MWKSVLVAAGLTMTAMWYHVAQLPLLPPATSHTDPGSLAATVSLASTHRDLGTTSESNLWEVAFPVHNIGGRRLVVNQLDTTCDCSERSLKTILVAPGETVDLIVTLDTRMANGEVENIASFTTSDPNHPYLHLTVRAVVVDSTH